MKMVTRNRQIDNKIRARSVGALTRLGMTGLFWVESNLEQRNGAEENVGRDQTMSWGHDGAGFKSLCPSTLIICLRVPIPTYTTCTLSHVTVSM